jgi:hypothetical protein
VDCQLPSCPFGPADSTKHRAGLNERASLSSGDLARSWRTTREGSPGSKLVRELTVAQGLIGAIHQDHMTPFHQGEGEAYPNATAPDFIFTNARACR